MTDDGLLIAPWLRSARGLTAAESAAVQTVRDRLRAADTLPAGVFWLDPATGRTTTIYLHYAFDLWANRWRQREATGDAEY